MIERLVVFMVVGLIAFFWWIHSTCDYECRHYLEIKHCKEKYDMEFRDDWEINDCKQIKCGNETHWVVDDICDPTDTVFIPIFIYTGN